MAKAKKKRAEHYEKPVKIQRTFSDVIKVGMTQPPSAPDKPKEKAVKNLMKNPVNEKIPRWLTILLWVAAILFMLSFIWRKAVPPNPFNFPIW